jgi:cyclic-di-GMP-binding protein
MPFWRLVRKPAVPAGSSLELSLPAQEPYSPDLLDIRARSVKQWLADLPWAHTGRTAEQVFDRLVRSNRLLIEPAERLRFLEQIRNATRYVGQSLRKHYIGMTFSLPPASQDVTALAETLHAELAIGYKAVVRDLSASASKREARLLPLATHRSMRCLSRVLLVNWHTYMPSPEGVWFELHRLYQFAEARGYEGRPVTDESYDLIQEGTVSDVYKQIAMLALTDPYHLPQHDIDKVYVAMEQWAPLVDLRPVEDGDGPECFVTLLHEDEPPARIALQDGARSDYRLLDTSRLVEMLRTQLGKGGSEKPSRPFTLDVLDPGPVSSDATLSYLLQHWDARPERQADRASRELPVKVINGLSAIHQHLESQARQRAREAGTDAPEEEAPWVPLGAPRTAPVVRVDLEVPPTFGSSMPASRDCVAIDHGVGGCRLRWGLADIENVKVGALLLVDSEASAERRASLLGVARWIKQEKGEPLETGVEWLTPNPLPVRISPARSGTAAPRTVAGLVMPKRHLDRRILVLVPSLLTYRAGDDVNVEAPEGVKRYKLTAVLEQSAAFSQLQLAVVHEPEPVQTTAPAEQRPPSPWDRFGDIWERL